MPALNTTTLEEVESVVIETTAHVLQMPDVERTDNFFDLGVDSLVAARILTELRNRLGVDVPLVQVFETPDIDEFCESLLDLLAEAETDQT
ncbi:phosphopantetheine-binding protein [Streptomyces sp. NPDC101110]|uniref:phosphopantetheine-binding protein n=1 Tax=unclassified Streptomyces TaxID=2593676 RepID=UPI003804DB31